MLRYQQLFNEIKQHNRLKKSQQYTSPRNTVGTVRCRTFTITDLCCYDTLAIDVIYLCVGLDDKQSFGWDLSWVQTNDRKETCLPAFVAVQCSYCLLRIILSTLGVKWSLIFLFQLPHWQIRGVWHRDYSSQNCKKY